MTRRTAETGRDEIAALHADTLRDLRSVREWWPHARTQLDIASAPPARSHEETAEQQAERVARERAERLERDDLAPGEHPAPLHTGALTSLDLAETILLELADSVAEHHGHTGGRSVWLHGRELPERSTRHRAARFPVAAAVKYLTSVIPALDDRWLSQHAATECRLAAQLVKTVVGLPEPQIKLRPCCFVCGEPSLRLFVGRRIVECRNPDCAPTSDQCGVFGPGGEPRWLEAEFDWLAARLGVDFHDQLRELSKVREAS